MEDFHELVAEKVKGKPTGRLTPGTAVSRIELKEGETKVLALKSYKLGPPPEVIVSTPNPDTAFCFQSSKLKDATKKSYNEKKMSDMKDALVPIDVNGWFYFQVCGRSAGTATLTANRFGTPPYTAYANPVTVSVSANGKKMNLGVPFSTLWRNHPLQDSNGHISFPCEGNGKHKQPELNDPLRNMQCMVRLCWALDKSGVNLDGMRGLTACNIPKKSHAHHFSNPYEFRNWSVARGNHLDWAASGPYAPEPMPGLAAFWYVMNRTGIILFDHYFDAKGVKEPMFGGHIDLWNKNTMGNTIHSANVYDGLSAFLRSKKISFWPID